MSASEPSPLYETEVLTDVVEIQRIPGYVTWGVEEARGSGMYVLYRQHEIFGWTAVSQTMPPTPTGRAQPGMPIVFPTLGAAIDFARQAERITDAAANSHQKLVVPEIRPAGPTTP